MQKVSESDSVAIAITTVGYDGKLRVSEFDASSERQGPAMQGLTAIAIDILGSLASASNTGKHDDLMFGNIQLLERAFDGSIDEKISTSRTPLNFIQTATHFS